MINEQIRDREVRLIGEDGQLVGIMSSRDAYKMAQDAGLDLVKIAPKAQPPVCKIVDYGKYRYEQARKEKEAKKKQKTMEVKEVRLSPNIDANDLNTKINQARKFLEHGDKVKVTLRFRGRELAHVEQSKVILDNFAEKLAEIAHAHDIPLVVDNTTSTAYLIQVLKHGADIVVNSSSKYINGSSNAISGILTDSGKFKWDKNRYPGFADYVKYGPMAFVAKLRNSLFRNMGACLAPVNAYLNIIGLETLGLRMERECSNALELASWIENNYPDIRVNYPGLCSSKWHEIAKKQLTNGYGAILTIRVGSKEKAFKFIDSLMIPYTLSNIGDTKTLVIHPGSTISLHSTDKQKEDAGVFEDLIRVSVGIEDIDDLKEDFAQAFANIAD